MIEINIITLCLIGIVIIVGMTIVFKLIDINRQKDFEVVLSINEVMNVLARGILSKNYKKETNKILDDLIELKELLNKEK